MLALVVLLGAMYISGPVRKYDFRQFYAAGKLVVHDPAHLYDLAAQKMWQDSTVSVADLPLPFYHPSYEALLYAPLAFLGFKMAYFVYLVWNMLLVGVCFMLAPPAHSSALREVPRPALLLLFVPLLICVLEGQNSVLFLLLMCLVWRSIEAGDEVTSGKLMALGLFKLQLAIPLALLLTARFGTRFLRGFLPVAAAVSLLCIFVAGPHATLDFFGLLRRASLIDGNGSQNLQSFSVWPTQMPTLYGLLYSCGTRFLSARAAFMVNAVASVGLLAGCLYWVRKVKANSAAFGIAILCALLFAQHLFIYEYTLLLLPILLLEGPAMPFVAGLCYLVPLVLFLESSAWFAFAAFLPVLLMAVSFSAERTLALAPSQKHTGATG